MKPPQFRDNLIMIESDGWGLHERGDSFSGIAPLE
jgi:hypothetical protein